MSLDPSRAPGQGLGPRPGRPRLADTSALFLDSKRARGRKERTIEDYRKKLGLFERWMSGGRRGALHADAGPAEIEGYLAHLEDRGVSEPSRKNHLAVLRGFFGAVSGELGMPDPFLELGPFRLRQADPDRTILTERQAERLLAVVDTAKPLGARDHAIFCSMLGAGLRIGEVTGLGSEDLRLEAERGREGGGAVLVGPDDEKRCVPIPPDLRSSLRRYLAFRKTFLPPNREPPSQLFLNAHGAGMSENTVRRTLYKYARRAGLSPKAVQPHNLRATFAARFLREYPSRFPKLAETMGYSNPSPLAGYLPDGTSDPRFGIDKL